MALVKLEIDGKRIIADGGRTILEVARENGILSIPTLCHDEQLEPFASCFLCVVKVKGARSLVPACSTKVGAGMVVETNDDEIRRSRKAALELLLSNHYADCVGPCQLACPAEVDIQGYIALAALGKYRDAVQLIKEKNPLPSVCGRVCTRPCEVKGCRRNLLDEAVGIDWIKRYVTDLDLGSGDAWRPALAPPNGNAVAVVGAGPAGLSCAYFLAVRGYQVDMFEALPEAGGMLRYGIPEYRLPKDVLDLEINQILSLGVRLKTNAALGRDFTVASLKQDGYRAIYLGLGAWKSSEMRVKGEESEGVLSGIEFLKNFGLRRKIDLWGRVLVVGGGNTAIDCARTALRLGVKEVRVLYRRTRNEMPANAAEIEDAEQEGVKLDFLVAPVRVITANGRVTGVECLRMELGEPDASGRRSPKPIRGSEFVVEGDFILSAIGQATRVPELLDGHVPDFLPFGEALNLTRWQTIQTNEGTGETSVEGVFAGGDVVTGAATAIEAIAAGRKAAHAIEAYLTSSKARPEPKEFVSRKDSFAKISVADLRNPTSSQRRPMPLLTVEDRIKTFAEVEQGYTAEDIEKETRRCLECGCTALFDCGLRRYATEYGVDISRFLGEAKQYKIDTSHPLIELDPNKCILCGRCVRICSEVVGVAAYGYLQRGFDTVVQPAMGGSLLDTDCVTCGLCIGTCPTGAIAQKIPLAKPGPWRTRAVPSICSYCGVGCRIAYDTFGDTVVKIGRCEDNPVTFGNHCKKGRFGYDLVHAEDRLRKAKVRAGRVLQDTPLDDATGYAAMRLRELSRRYAGSQMAVFVSPRFTNEEIYLAQKLARVALRTHDIGSLAHLVNHDLQCPEVVSTASYRDAADAQVILLAGSRLDKEHFVADLIVKRALRGGGKLVYIHPEANQVARLAEVFIRCRPGTEAQVVLGIVREALASAGEKLPDLPWLAEALSGLEGERFHERTGADPALVKEAARLVGRSILKVLIFNKDYRGPRSARDSRVYAASARMLGASLLVLREKANMQGLLDMGAFPEWYPGYRSVRDESVVDDLEKEWCVALRDLETAPSDLAARIRERKIKVAVILGEDPLGDPEFPEDLKAGLLRRQLRGELNLRMADLKVSDLLDDINTDAMAPAWACFDWRPADIARNAYAGISVDGQRLFPEGSLIDGNFEVIVSGFRKGVGSSRETAVQAEKWSGIRIAIAASFAPIHARNNLNQGVLMGDHTMLARLQAGESLALDEFTHGWDPLTRSIIEHGGLFAFTKSLARGEGAMPGRDTSPRPMTMTEKILSRHLVDAPGAPLKPGDPVCVRVDGGYSHEFTTAQVHAFLEEEFGPSYTLANPAKFAVFEDHLIYADGVASMAKFSPKIQILRDMQRQFQRHTGVQDWSAENGISPGICHTVARERIIEPGDFIQSTDSHTCMGGSVGALAYGVGTTEYAALVHAGFTFVVVPDSIRFELTGRLSTGVTAKDVMLYILANHAKQQLTLDKVLEFGGPGLRSLSPDERATLANMATECSAKSGICEVDDTLLQWIAARRHHAVSPDKVVGPDADAHYAGGVHIIDLSTIRPMVATPGDPARGIPSDPTNGAYVSEIGEVPITIAYGGSCTAGKEDDIDMYARVMTDARNAGRRVRDGVDFYIQFGSKAVEEYARKKGYLQVFQDTGVKVISPGCGACIGCGPGVSSTRDEVSVSAINRNYQNRSGPGKLYLASPLNVAASAVAGKIVAYEEGMFSKEGGE